MYSRRGRPHVLYYVLISENNKVFITESKYCSKSKSQERTIYRVSIFSDPILYGLLAVVNEVVNKLVMNSHVAF